MQQIKFISKREVAEDTFLYVFEKPEGFTFHAGQYVSLMVPNKGFEDKRGFARALSIANAPYEDTLEFVMRQSGSAFKQNIALLEPGDIATITPALGHCKLPENSEAPLMIALVGGVGITPARSMIRQSLHENRPSEWKLFYSNKAPSTAPLFDEFDAMKNEKFTCIHTMTHVTDGSWEGEQGYITQEVIEKYTPNAHEAHFLLAGTTPFVDAMQAILTSMDIPEEHIMMDNFGTFHKV